MKVIAKNCTKVLIAMFTGVLLGACSSDWLSIDGDEEFNAFQAYLDGIHEDIDRQYEEASTSIANDAEATKEESEKEEEINLEDSAFAFAENYTIDSTMPYFEFVDYVNDDDNNYSIYAFETKDKDSTEKYFSVLMKYDYNTDTSQVLYKEEHDESNINKFKVRKTKIFGSDNLYEVLDNFSVKILDADGNIKANCDLNSMMNNLADRYNKCNDANTKNPIA